MQAGTGGMRPPAKDHEAPPEAGGAARSPSWSLQRTQPPPAPTPGGLTSRVQNRQTLNSAVSSLQYCLRVTGNGCTLQRQSPSQTPRGP